MIPEQSNEGNKPDSSKVILTAVAPLISILTGGFIVSVIAPMVCWLIWKDRDPMVNRVGKNVLNGQLSWCLYILIGALLCFVLIGLLIGSLLYFVLIGLFIVPIISLLWLIFSIVNAVKVANGRLDYVMPFTIRFLK